MIKPTLFIGIGTTGTNILKMLRELMSEKYENAGLPILRYISIETRETETGDNSKKFKDYEQIKVINATIDETAPIQNQFDPNQPSSIYQSQLVEWLNPDLLSHIESFKDGAHNIRMVGRLCLWENWKEILRTLSNAYNQIINVANIHRTQEILLQHYETKNLDVPYELVNNDCINIYVFGSLCGGSCSGMLIDMAYYLRRLLGGGAVNNVYGIFTMYDRLLAESNSMDDAVRAANCYASLSELNYYNHPNTTYDVTFPNSLTVNTTRKPFDYELVVSPSGKIPHIRHVSPDGSFDEYGLNLMVALNLFLEAAGDTGGHKAAIRADWQGFEGYGQLKPVPVGKIPTMTRCLASFGLTAVWYPKYRIASAAAYSASMDLCKKMKGGHTSDEKIKDDAINEWHGILENVDILTRPQVDGRPTLESEVTDHLNNLEGKVLNRKSSAQQLERMLKSYPGSDAGSFAERFSRSGTYYAWMEGKIDSCRKAFREAIDNALQNQLSRVFSSPSTYGISDVQKFFEELESVIETTQGRIQNELPTLNLEALNFGAMRRAEKNIWTSALGFREESVNSHRESLIDEYRKLIIGESVGIYHKVRYYFLGKVLDDIRAKLGFGEGSEINTVKQQLEQIQSNLNGCIQIFTEEYHEYIRPPLYECVKIVANNPQNSIQIDAESLSDQIINDITSGGLLVENGNLITIATFLKKGHEELMLQMTETLRRSALNSINQDSSLVKKIQELSDTDGGIIRDLARRSNPYQEFTHEYHQPFNLSEQGGTKIIIGHDPSETNEGLKDLQEKLGFGRYGNSVVDHFLFFYEEEAGFALDDLAAYEALKQHFEESPGIYGHWTHQDPSFYDTAFHHKKQKLQQWCNVLARLVPLIWERVTSDVFSNVFRRENDKCIFVYSIDGVGVTATLELLDDLNGIEKLSRKENSAAYNHFSQSVKDGFAQIDREKINHLINEMLNSVEDLNEHQDIEAMYTDFLEEVYLTDDN